MSERDARLELFRAALETGLPQRIVTRDYRHISLRDDADLEAGILSLVSLGEDRYQNLRNRLGDDACRNVLLIAQLRIAADENPLAVEQAELELFEEVLAVLRAGTGLLRSVDLREFRQSGQLDHPYGGWVLEMEILS